MKQNIELELRDTRSPTTDDQNEDRQIGVGEDGDTIREGQSVEYRTYKRRWFGLATLTFLNIVVSWDVRFTTLSLSLSLSLPLSLTLLGFLPPCLVGSNFPSGFCHVTTRKSSCNILAASCNT
jgi:hypothetical protein